MDSQTCRTTLLGTASMFLASGYTTLARITATPTAFNHYATLECDASCYLICLMIALLYQDSASRLQFASLCTCVQSTSLFDPSTSGTNPYPHVLLRTVACSHRFRSVLAVSDPIRPHLWFQVIQIRYTDKVDVRACNQCSIGNVNFVFENEPYSLSTGKALLNHLDPARTSANNTFPVP